ncbi:hypothetical protein ACR78G_20255 [Sphingobacterium spiritivorum]|uniref:hypothetical protein n=1 Tax=Sphingobacterium spiritivorum TaxID=258 RepID=UPI003DA673A6
MKHILFLLLIAVLSGCTNNDLTKQEAKTLIEKELGYPKQLDYEVFTSDPLHAEMLLEKGLEKKGLVTVKKTQTFSEIGEPLITFTNQSKVYLLPASAKQQEIDVQPVKIGVESINEITTIDYDNSSKIAVVEYTTRTDNITPFAVLANYEVGKEKTRTTTFRFDGKKWKVDKRKQ